MQDVIFTKTWELQHVRVRGDYACFTHTETRIERFSSVVPSHSAWEGMFSQIMGKKGSRYHIRRAAMLFHPRWFSCKSHEISTLKGLEPFVLDISRKNFTLRTTSFLSGRKRNFRNDDGSLTTITGVDYIVSFQLETRVTEDDLEKAREQDKEANVYTEARKRYEMLQRRLRNGHYRGAPYLGLRECNAKIEPIWDLSEVQYPEMDLVEHPDYGFKAVPYSMPLGFHYFGTDWDDTKNKPDYFYPMMVEDGVIVYPTWDEVRQYNKRSA